jgi:hypothetical protein
MMNGRIVAEASGRLADQLLGDANLDNRARLAETARLIFGRPAAADEISDWEAFLGRYQAAASLASETPERRRRLAWQGLCRALLSSNEFLYVN